MENINISATLLNEKNKIILDKERSQKKLTGFASIDKPWEKFYEESDLNKPLPEKTIYRYAKDNNINSMDLTAINFYGFKENFEKFFEKIDKTASSFVKIGVKKGDIVTICAPTTPETKYANYALNKIGAIAYNIDPRTNAKRIKESINMAESDYLVMLDVAFPKISSIIRETGVKKVIVNSFSDFIPPIAKPIFKYKLKKTLKEKGMSIPKINDPLYISWNNFIKEGKGTVAEEVPYSKDYPAAMVLTGGTTGFPKSVMLTNESVMSVVESYKATDLGLEKGQSLLNIMPLFIAYGWTFGIVMAPSLSIEDIIIPQFDVNDFAEYIKKYEPNHIVGVPTHLTALRKDERMKDMDLSKFLISISAGGDFFFVEDEREFNKFLHEHGFERNAIVGYGLTEGNSSIATRLNKCNVEGSIGIPLPRNNMSIFKFPENEAQAGTCEELPYGEKGEICFTGDSMMAGYYKQDEKTKQVQILHKDGKVWTHTKDSGYVNEDGVFFVDGRTKRMIIRPDGHNVWPIEMENIIMKNDNVDNCIVIGIPSKDATQGEYPRAVVALKETCKKTSEEVEQELRKTCLESLPERDIPYSYTFVDKIPLTNVGKIDFNAVRDNEISKDNETTNNENIKYNKEIKDKSFIRQRKLV